MLRSKIDAAALVVMSILLSREKRVGASRKLSFIDPGVPAKVLPFNIDYSALQFLVTRRVGRRELIPNAPRC